MKLGTVVYVLEDLPAAVQLGVVVSLDKVREGGAWVLDLLVAITERGESDRPVRVECIRAVMPVEDASDTGRRGACIYAR